jgi:hypothetical protein
MGALSANIARLIRSFAHKLKVPSATTLGPSEYINHTVLVKSILTGLGF